MMKKPTGTLRGVIDRWVPVEQPWDQAEYKTPGPSSWAFVYYRLNTRLADITWILKAYAMITCCAIEVYT